MPYGREACAYRPFILRWRDCRIIENYFYPQAGPYGNVVYFSWRETNRRERFTRGLFENFR